VSWMRSPCRCTPEADVPRLRKRALSLLIGAGVLFFLATNVQAGWLFVLSALMIGIVLAGWIMPVGATRGLQVERDAPARVHQGEEALIDLRASSASRGTRRGVMLRDTHLESGDVWVGRIRPGERVEVTTLRTAARRGVHEGSAVSVRSRAPFGIAERRRTIAVGGNTLVLPRVVPLGPLPFIDPAATTEPAIHTAPRRGQGPEYLGIREYRPGDSMRHVHWPSTARLGAVMVREFEQQQTRRLAIVVDSSRDRGEIWTPLDRACCAAASIASASLAQGHGARLVTGTDDERPEVLTRAEEGEIFERLAVLGPVEDGVGSTRSSTGSPRDRPFEEWRPSCSCSPPGARTTRRRCRRPSPAWPSASLESSQLRS